MEPTYQIWSFYDKNCDRITLFRQTDGLTDRSMETEGPSLVTSPFMASFSLEWSNKRVPKLSILLFQEMILTSSKFHEKSKQTNQGKSFQIYLSCVRHISVSWKTSLVMRTSLHHHLWASIESCTVPTLI